MSINTQLNRCSIRSFKNQPLSNDTLETIFKAANQSPNSGGGQQYSIIAITDTEKREKLYEWTIGRSGKGMDFIKDAPVFLIFIMDFYKINVALETENRQLKINNCIESILVGSIDVGIAAEALSAAAESLGLGTVFVGGIRKNTQEIIELCQLPEYTFPLIGMAIGYPSETEESSITPRPNIESLIHYNVYNQKIFGEVLQEYNTIMKSHYLSKGFKDLDWINLMSRYYEREMYPELKNIFKKQNFIF